MMNALCRAPIWLVALAVFTATNGCTAFNKGMEDAFESDVDDEYGWGYEFYEMPLGLIGFPVFVALSPFLYWIPGGGSDEFGYPLGRAFGGDFIYIDPTANYQ